MNINGSLMVLESKTTSAGVSVGNAEKIIPKDEKLNAVSNWLYCYYCK
jgi:hypothetical protein